MKVTDPKLQVVIPTKSAQEGPVRAAAPVERVSTVHSEAVAAAVAQVKSSLPADRAARIAQIAQAVKKGNYQPNPQQIAERIIDDAELAARLQAMLDR